MVVVFVVYYLLSYKHISIVEKFGTEKKCERQIQGQQYI
jgi:hypothetical protein